MTKKFFNYFKKETPPPSAPVSKIHLKCNDNEANTNVTNSGSLGGYGTASANTSLMSSAGKITNSFYFNNIYSVNLDTFVNSIKSDSVGTFTMWVYISDYSPTPPVRGILLDTSESGGFEVTLSTQTKKLQVACFNPPVDGFIWSSDVLTANNWYFLSIKQDGSSVVCKVNNAPSGDFDFAEFYSNRSQWLSGLSFTTLTMGGDSCPWKLDDVRYYSVALTDAQITQIYNSGNGTEDELT